MMEEDTSQLQVPEARYRIWGLAHSPGGATTAVLVSRYSTLHPERRALCKLMFSRRDEERDEAAGTVAPAKQLTTEGQVWEWMYGNGPEVLGTTSTSKISPELHNTPLREQFKDIAGRQRCVFCDAALYLEEDEAKCENGHLFGKLGIQLLSQIILLITWNSPLRLYRSCYHGSGYIKNMRRV
jgi:hypothetical protein